MDLTFELLDPLYLFYFLFVKKTHWPNIAFNIILFYYLINLCLFFSRLHIKGIHIRQARRNYQFIPQILWQAFEHQSSDLLSNWVLFKKVRKTAPLKPVKRLQAIWWKRRDQHWNHFTCQSIFVLALVKPVKHNQLSTRWRTQKRLEVLPRHPETAQPYKFQPGCLLLFLGFPSCTLFVHVHECGSAYTGINLNNL